MAWGITSPPLILCNPINPSILKQLKLLFGLNIFLLLFAANLHAQQWEVEKNSEGILIIEGNKKVLFYQTAQKSLNGTYTRSNYIHPLYGIHQEVITEDFPEDHPHQRGIFWTWHQILIGDKRIGDGWDCRDIQWDVVKADTKPSNDGQLSIRSEVEWKSPNYLSKNGKKKAFVKEENQITVYPEKDSLRIIDFAIKINALVDSFFIGGSEDAKGYGGFSTRIALSDSVAFYGKNGKVEPQNLAVEAGSWIEIQNQPYSGMVIMCHKDNPGMPHSWILRYNESMQNPVYPGNKPLHIAQGHSLILKYRLVLAGRLVKSQEITSIIKHF